MTELASRGWPDDGSPIGFEELARPLKHALRFAYAMRRQNRTKDVPWRGPDIGWRERATCLSPDESLKAKYLAEAKEDQGRDTLDAIIAVAIQLGIEQGRRIYQSGPEYQAMKFQLEAAQLVVRPIDGE